MLFTISFDLRDAIKNVFYGSAINSTLTGNNELKIFLELAKAVFRVEDLEVDASSLWKEISAKIKLLHEKQDLLIHNAAQLFKGDGHSNKEILASFTDTSAYDTDESHLKMEIESFKRMGVTEDLFKHANSL